jgi:hypothetical protein
MTSEISAEPAFSATVKMPAQRAMSQFFRVYSVTVTETVTSFALGGGATAGFREGR